MEGGVKHEDTMAEAATLSQAASAPATRKRGSTNSDPAAKRARQTRRHDDWWLPDGSVVLELHGVQFRLYRAQLARPSPFFHKLFAEPASETVDDCPLYVLERGTPEEFAALLEADDSFGNDYTSERPTFRQIIPVLRMATFYEFPRAREWAVAIAQYYWPSGSEKLPPGLDEDVIDALLLAAEYDLPEVAKACWLVLLVRWEKIPHLERLPALLLKRLLFGQRMYMNWWTKEALRPRKMKCASPEDAPSCPNKETRTTQVFTWAKAVHDSGIFSHGLNHPVAGLSRLCDSDWQKSQYCTRCADAMSDRLTALRITLWDELDEWFGLKGDAQ